MTRTSGGLRKLKSLQRFLAPGTVGNGQGREGWWVDLLVQSQEKPGHFLIQLVVTSYGWSVT